MLLTRFRRAKDDERGAALIATIGVLCVVIIIAATVGAVTINAMGLTSATKAGVQSQSAAESGLDATIAQLQTSACPAGGLYSRTAAPVYAAQVYYSTTTTSTWVKGCPRAGTKYVRLVSQGTASALGAAGNKTGNRSTVEGVYSFTPNGGAIAGTGSSAYSYLAGNFDNAQLISDSDVLADVQIKTGNLQCNNSTIQGSLIVGSGSASVQGDCTVKKDVFAGSPVTIAGKVGGSVVAGPFAATAQSMIFPSAKIGGDLRLAGSINTWGVTPCGSGSESRRLACGLRNAGVIGANYSTEDASITRPMIPEWIDFKFSAGDWTGLGYVVKTWTGSCMVDNNPANQKFLSDTIALGQPVAIDATGCGANGLTFSTSANLTLNLFADVAFIAPKINIEGLQAKTANGSPRQIRFITPDNVNDRQPTCGASQGTVKIDSGVVMHPGVTALIYTPCAITNSSTGWRGQMYAGVVSFNSNFSLTAAQVGLPGVDLSTGQPTGGGSVGGTLGERLLLRDYNGPL
jgi:Tfp pilus assembly protein PilX